MKLLQITGQDDAIYIINPEHVIALKSAESGCIIHMRDDIIIHAVKSLTDVAEAILIAAHQMQLTSKLLLD